MRFLFSLLLVSLLCVSCDRYFTKTNGGSIVKVGDHVLSREELDRNLQLGLSPEDSIIAAEHFIHSWINEQLLLDIASRNIGNKEEIEKLVENYRRSLIVYQYQEQLVNEKLDRELSEDVLLRFYEENKDGFKLDRPLIKGLYLKIPQGAPRIDKVKVWYKSLKPDDIENMETYSIQNSTTYGYFVDQWEDFYDLVDDWPVNFKNEISLLKDKKFIEQQDESFYYFLHLTDVLLPGETTPFEYTKPVVREMVLNQKKREFLKKTEEDLYDRALSRGQIIFHNE